MGGQGGMSRRTFVIRTAQAGAAAAAMPTLLSAAARAQSPSAAPVVQPGDKKVRIGLALPTMSQYRWKFDQKYFEEAVAALGDEVIVQAADDDETKQSGQVENFISQGVDVLVIAPVNVEASSSLIDQAKDAGIGTISYNYVARNTDKLDFWVARDNVLVGHITADEALKMAPKGNYVILSGDAATDVAQDKTKGYMERLQPHIDAGDITVVSQQFNKGWDPALGLAQVEDALTSTDNQVAAVLGNYDGFALSALQALQEQGLEGKVFVGGEDVFPEAAQAIVEGRMAMSSYTDLREMATKAAQAAHELGNGRTPMGDFTIDNGAAEVLGSLISSYAVTAENMPAFIADTGWVDYDTTYENVPADQRPPKG
jgi:D-xylose transport system substrate-binding protein